MNEANQVRVNDLASELGVKARAIIGLLAEFGVTEKKTHSSSIPADVADKVRKRINPQAEAAVGPEAKPVARPDARPAFAAKLDPRQSPVVTPPERPGKAATPPAAATTPPWPSQQGMRYSCRCNGENENCRWCGGSGILEDRLIPAFVDETLRRRTIEESKAKASPRPQSQWWMPSYASVPVPVEIKCPKGCGRWMEIQEVQSHLANCTGVSVVPAQKIKSTPASDPRAEEARPTQVRSDNEPEYSEGNDGPVEGDETDAYCVEAPDGGMNIDATKDIGYPAREWGSRYGSHPTHDSFDDESEP